MRKKIILSERAAKYRIQKCLQETLFKIGWQYKAKEIKPYQFIVTNRSNQKIGDIALWNKRLSIYTYDEIFQKDIFKSTTLLANNTVFSITYNNENNRLGLFLYPHLTPQETKILIKASEPQKRLFMVHYPAYGIITDKNYLRAIGTMNGGIVCWESLMVDQVNKVFAVLHKPPFTSEYDLGMIRTVRTQMIQKGAKPQHIRFYATPNFREADKKIIAKLFNRYSYDLPNHFYYEFSERAPRELTSNKANELNIILNKEQSLKSEIQKKHGIIYFQQNGY
ncbi:hypothetical protein ACFL57_04220 [Candidatus Margulisiibacteriota bacterium]